MNGDNTAISFINQLPNGNKCYLRILDLRHIACSKYKNDEDFFLQTSWFATLPLDKKDKFKSVSFESAHEPEYYLRYNKDGLIQITDGEVLGEYKNG